MDDSHRATPPGAHLERIRTITDVALSHLGSAQLLDELLDRARDVLDADTAAVLLLDEDHSYLVATAARGIEEEVRQGVRIPLGRGFAGRIAAERRPVILDRVDHTTVLNPILRRRGIRSLLGVPLLAEGSVIGVVHVGTLGNRRFTSDDAELLQMIGDRIANVIAARRAEDQQRATTVLQSSLLPGRLPYLSDLEFAARYVPGGGEGVGGDWYDAFLMPSGWLWVVMGDIAGRGLRAAVVMGRVRSAVRAYALMVDRPDEVLSLVDRKVRHFEPGEMATVLLAAIDPTHYVVHLSSAGHPPPVLAPDDGDATVVSLAVDPPIGTGLGGPRRTTEVPLPPGAVLCLYTDGLVERRDQALDARIEMLRATVRPDDPEAVCAEVMGRLVGADVASDDIALLVVRRTALDRQQPLELSMPAEITSLAPMRAGLRRWLVAVGAEDSVANDVLLAVGEACSNAVEHAYGPAVGLVHLYVELNGDRVVARVADSGQWRDPRGRGRGRGSMIMRAVSDDVRTETSEQGTTLWITKRLRP